MNKKYVITFEVQDKKVYLKWFKYGKTHIVTDKYEAKKYDLKEARKIAKLLANKNAMVEEANTDIKRIEPIAYKIYEYLKTNAVGEENKKTAKEIMEEFNLKNDCAVRYYIRKIRDNEFLQKVICSKAGCRNNGYWIGTTKQEVYKNIKNENDRYVNGLARVSKQMKKLKLHNYFKLPLFSKGEKKIFESIIEKGN